jgi:NAD+ dependent glucose-6-phosphate dehydrogenase
MSSNTVLITGASGNIGRVLRAHFNALGWNLRLLDRNPKQESDIIRADLSRYEKSWAKNFAETDTVIHLAADNRPWADWATVYKDNWLTTENVLRAAAAHRVKRVIFASSNWVMAGYRFSEESLTVDLPPRPINPYGVSKLHGERLGRVYADKGLSFIALRIGWCRHTPGMVSRWDQLKWVSYRDMCQVMQQCVQKESIDFAVLCLMSANPGMRWDIEPTKKILGYVPEDGAAAVFTHRVWTLEFVERIRYKLASFNV